MVTYYCIMYIPGPYPRSLVVMVTLLHNIHTWTVSKVSGCHGNILVHNIHPWTVFNVTGCHGNILLHNIHTWTVSKVTGCLGASHFRPFLPPDFLYFFLHHAVEYEDEQALKRVEYAE